MQQYLPIVVSRVLLPTAFCLFLTIQVRAQPGVGISTTGGSPDPSAILDLSSTTKGSLVPRMSTTERDLISSPAQGLTIFNTTTNCFNMRVGSIWKQWCGECEFAAPTLGNNGPICEGATLNLTATGAPGGATYAWAGPNGFSSASQNPSISNATAGASGTYTLKTTSGGCTLSSSIEVTVKKLPQTPTIQPSSNPICPGNTLALYSNNITGATYSWTGPNSFTSALQNPAISNVSTANSGAYSLVVTVNGCSSPAESKTITVALAAFGSGTVTHIGGYAIHTFTSSGTFTPMCSGNVEVLVVAGGGGGGNGNPGGGGGAGGLIYNASFAVTPQQYNVTVGAGGAAQSNGSNSVFGSLTAIGGGAGGLLAAPSGNNGSAGGSGGGGAAYGGSGAITRPGGAGTAGQGNAGGSGTVGSGALYAAGGGGGAGAAGGNATTDSPANGGAGLSFSISGTPTFYAGGGGGSRYPSQPAGLGGVGGGGNGGVPNHNIPAVAGTPNTGGGGGGGQGAAGGSGIVIIRYPE